jgi:putative GTP pyrophosphokinase
MQREDIEIWLNAVLPKHERLTTAVKAITENLLTAEKIEFLAVTGRTKSKDGAVEKIQRKGYKSPDTQLTDLSGVRIIVYLESDLDKVCSVITKAFNVHKEHSLDKQTQLPTNQTGYRSVHFVCDLTEQRAALPEFAGLKGLRFEFQVRTVLQHAWAELAHDRNYKFAGKLPKDIERNLYLYAGLLEIADKGFSEISSSIDSYLTSVQNKSAAGDFSSEVDSLSLVQYVENWAANNEVSITSSGDKSGFGELVQELHQFGVSTLDDLRKIVPKDYEKKIRKSGSINIYGIVRDWMLITDWRKYRNQVSYDWGLGPDDLYPISDYLNSEELPHFIRAFSPRDE